MATYLGEFDHIDLLKQTYVAANKGDFAFLNSTNTFFIYENGWINSGTPDLRIITGNMSKIVYDPLGKESQIVVEDDIVDNLTSTISYVPLSARQGKILNDKIDAIGESVNEYEIFEIITSGTSGSVTVPTEATIILDQYKNAGDCLILKVGSNNKPIDDPARDSSGNIVTSTLAVNGNYQLSGNPSVFPISIIYQIQIKEKYKSNIDPEKLVNESFIIEKNQIVGLRDEDPVLFKGLTLSDLAGVGDRSIGVSSSGEIKALVLEVEYTNATPVPVTIGGIAAGQTFLNKTMPEMWDSLLYPYQSPSFSAFGISGQSTPIEVGDVILANRTFTWATTNPSNINANSIIIRDVSGSTDIATGLANDGSETVVYGSIQKVIAATNTFSISGINSNAIVFTRNYIVSWYWRRFYGESVLTTLNEAAIEGLSVSGLSSAFAGTYNFASGGYKYISYPSALGTATTFKDASTNLDIPFETVYVVSVTNTFGITTNYNVHRSTNILGSAINIIVT